MTTPMTPTNFPARPLPLCLLAIGLLAISTSVRADYTVINDDLLPTAVIDARYAQPTQRFAVQFTKGRSALTEMSRNTLSTLIPIMQGSEIKIIGRPDATPATKGVFVAIPGNRARNIRDYLTRQGIPYNSITIEIDNSPNPQQNGNGYPCDVIVTRIDHSSMSPLGFSASVIASTTRQQQPFAQAPQQQQQSQAYSPQPQQLPAIQPQQQRYAPAPMPAYQQPATLAPAYQPQQPPAPAQPLQIQKNSAQDGQDQLIQYINQAVQSGRMAPSVAIKMIRAAMLEPITAAQMPAGQQLAYAQMPTQPIAPPQQALFVASPALVRKETWTLDAKLTLRDNLDAWSKLAGWNPSVWDASNYFQVTSASILEGGFPDILRQVADSTGLNICARKHEKYVRVTDANVPCTK